MLLGNVRKLFAAVLVVLALSACETDNLIGSIYPDDCDTPECQEQFDQLQLAKAALSTGEFDDAIRMFEDLEEQGADQCEIEYGILLGRIAETVDRVDVLVETASVFTAPGAQLDPQQFTGDLTAFIESFVEPFEVLFAKIRDRALYAIDNQCIFDLPGGLPLNLGVEGDALFASVEIGYIWDPAVARAILASIDGIQAVVNFVLAHRIELEDIDEALDIIGDRVDDAEDTDADAVTNVTLLDVVRSAGVIFDANPNLLAFRSDQRINEIDNNLREMYQTLYTRDPSTNEEEGVITSMINTNSVSNNPGDNVLGWHDDGDGIVGNGDTIVFGLRAINLASTIALTDNTGGIALTLTDAFGDVAEILRQLHEITYVLGNQMQAVEDDSLPRCKDNQTNACWRRLGMGDINAVIAAVSVAGISIDPIPEAIEIDGRAFFVGADGNSTPKSLRDLMPYWYDSDGCEIDDLSDHAPDCLADEFMIEGESEASVSNYTEFVQPGDSAHFPDSIQFGSFGDVDVTVDGLMIDPDGIRGPTLDVAIPLGGSWELPALYIGWQQPGFNGVLWVDTNELPVAPEETVAFDNQDGFFAVADMYTVNKLTNSFVAHYLGDGTDGL